MKNTKNKRHPFKSVKNQSLKDFHIRKVAIYVDKTLKYIEKLTKLIKQLMLKLKINNNNNNNNELYLYSIFHTRKCFTYNMRKIEYSMEDRQEKNTNK